MNAHVKVGASSARHAIACRDDLSFTGRTADDRGHMINWAPVRVPTQRDQWNIEFRLGEGMVEEVGELCSVDERAAYHSIRFAMTAPTWRVCGAGAESGFAAAVAALAVLGMRALRSGELPFDPDAVED
ncbi:hypothetical protein D9M68_361270 [compost metagenome]|uniref:hypothetical protein n=1 Tax=Pseudomonas jinjuensis TaxID=198616 RepID=UPI0011137D0E|nr:hypothetical protein [Pseudomonas jinjuensis]